MKAWDRHASCRGLAERFQRHFGERGFSVSKSYVARVLAANAGVVIALRRRMRDKHTTHTLSRVESRNRLWAMDLSYLGDVDVDLADNEQTARGELAAGTSGCATKRFQPYGVRQRIILGIVDHGTRACIALSELANKSSAAISAELLNCFRRYGIPRAIRVDNEACFHSPILRGALASLGVRVQTTDLASPWQNGRIERLFGTLKLDLVRICKGDLTQLLIEWRWYYNFARPHQRLNGRTPAEAWHRLKKQTGKGLAVDLWHGNLRGWYFRPS